MSDEQLDGQRPGWIVPAVAIALIAAVVGGVWLATRGPAAPREDPTPTPTPTATQTPPAETEPAATAPPEPSPTAEDSPEPPQDTARDPDESDVADFVGRHGPADRTATGDVTADGTDEVVIVRIRDDAAFIVVGSWDGSAYQRIFRDEGGPAQQIARLEVADYNGESGAEIVTEQTFGESGSSLSVWGWDGSAVQRHIAEGGCWDGFHTYGRVGATIEPLRIVATCDGSPLPPEGWTSDVYEWTEGAWIYARTQEPGE